jgi:hypothetical protein
MNQWGFPSSSSDSSSLSLNRGSQPAPNSQVKADVNAIGFGDLPLNSTSTGATTSVNASTPITVPSSTSAAASGRNVTSSSLPPVAASAAAFIPAAVGPQNALFTLEGLLAANSSLAALRAAVERPVEGHVEAEYVAFDGFYHNLARIDWGAVDKPLFRRVPPAYADGVLSMDFDRPNPRTLSNELMAG